MLLRARPNTTACLTALSMALAMSLAATAFAQSAPATKPTSASKSKSTPKPAKPAPAPAKPVTLPPASDAQMEAAKLAFLGPYDCEFGQTLIVERTPQHEGYIDVHHLKAVWTMKPVLSPTGVVRLEDVHGHMLMLQVANKSMVMDVQAGQRVLDGCLHERQRAFVKPANAESLGIAPATAAAPTAAAAPAAPAAATATATAAASTPR